MLLQRNKKAGIVQGWAPAPTGPESPVYVIAAHGGSCATTLCRWLGSNMVQDWGMSVPPHLFGSTVLVTCSATPHGTARAGELVKYLRVSTDCGIVIIVVTSDGRGPEPAAVKARLRMLSAHVDGIVRLPFIQRWRFLDDPLSEPVPRGYASQLQQLREQLQAFPSVDNSDRVGALQ